MAKAQTSFAIVDDHALMRECTSFKLSRLGYQVAMEADNGQSFLHNLTPQNFPDICLLDINMPVMDGFETIQCLKNKWPLMKVIFLSMHRDSPYFQKAMKLGADGFLAKDASFEEFKAVVNGVMALELSA